MCFGCSIHPEIPERTNAIRNGHSVVLLFRPRMARIAFEVVGWTPVNSPVLSFFRRNASIVIGVPSRLATFFARY